MSIAHHVDDATLMSYAAGSLPEVLSAVVATHLSLCSTCRHELSNMECIGAMLMTSLPPSTITTSAHTVSRDAAGGSTTAGVRKAGGAGEDAPGDVPSPLSRLVGAELSEIRWRRLGLGIWHHPIMLDDETKGDLRLIKVAPGQIMPEHGHGGSELTLVLSGSYVDRIGRFGPGDIADLDSDVEHGPVADRHTGCVCLIASEEKARFKGVLARIAQPFTGL